jgi:ribose 5-phosphate isomerase B
MKIAIASDHAGFEEKERLKPLLNELGIEFEDLGTGSTESVDYPDYACAIGEAIQQGRAERGVLLCGSGVGASVAASKLRGIRAAVGWVKRCPPRARRNDANVLSLAGRFSHDELARMCAPGLPPGSTVDATRGASKDREIENEELRTTRPLTVSFGPKECFAELMPKKSSWKLFDHPDCIISGRRTYSGPKTGGDGGHYILGYYPSDRTA